MNKLKFLKPILNFFIAGLLITNLSRILLFFMFSSRISNVDEFAYLFPIGIRFDLIILAYVAFLPTVLIFLLPNGFLSKIWGILKIYLMFFLCLILFMELATPSFLIQYDTRPNRLFIEYLVYPKEVITTLVKGYGVIMLIAGIVLSIVIYFAIKKGGKIFKSYPIPNFKIRVIAFPIVAFLLFFAARSSLTSIRPINASNAVFSNDQFTNSIALNSFYTAGFALYNLKNEEDMAKMYGTLPKDEALKRVKKYMTADCTFLDTDIPLLHEQKSTHKRDKPFNLVILLQESLGAEYVGSLGGLPLTPNIDALTKEGMLLTNLYATGTRSVRGIEAVTSGFLPTPSRSVVKLGKSKNGFFTLADALKRKGYQTSFIYGGSANFDDMASFFNGNGFDNIIDENDYEKEEIDFEGTWGISDESLMRKANQLFTSYEEKPFFSLVFSSSNHDPFEFPDGKIELYDKEKNTVNNAIKYADYAIGQFFKIAKNEAYYNNTVFIIVADHNTRTWGNDLIPINKFHIPALIIAPNVEGGITYDKLMSQIDIPPTLLDLVGMDVKTPMVGRNIYTLNDSIPGRAIMQFHTTNAFRNGDDLVVLQAKTKPVQFKVTKGDKMTKTTLDPELAKDALSHIVTASYLYNDLEYRLENKNKE